MEKQPGYRDQMFDALSIAIENTGKDDPSYDNHQKALDILSVLENLLAYTIYSTCDSADTVRDSCEESHVNIKKMALRMMENEQSGQNK